MAKSKLSKPKSSKINTVTILESIKKESILLKESMTEENLSQLNNKELGRLEDLLQEVEDLCYAIKTGSTQNIRKAS